MRALRAAVVLVLALKLSTPVLAADLKAGLDAFQRDDYATALKELRPLAEQGNAEAQYYLGRIYSGGFGVTQDYAEAMKWYRLAAEQGDAAAQFFLGVIYEFGWGVSQDYTEAVKWYRLAAEQGDSNGQGTLGLMYDQGLGVSQDYVQALMWFILATERASGRNFDALVSSRNDVEAKMTPEQIAEAQRLAREWKPK